jgi:7-cyano-7-deazaguanine synthase
MRALVLLSGGLDSAVCALLAKREGRSVSALTIAYGQRHALEVERARVLGSTLGLEAHEVAELPAGLFAGSALTDPAVGVPHGRSIDASIPATYVPARNLVFLAMAAAAAEARGIGEVWIGINAVDYSGYPDCRPEFVAAFQETLARGTRPGTEGRPVRVVAPLQDRSKREIVLLGRDLGLDFSLTWSCYDPGPDGRPCGRCDACVLRRKGFDEAGIPCPD